MKFCKRCGFEKEDNLFFKDSTKIDGLSTLCKDCKKIQKKKYKSTENFKKLKSEQGKRHYSKHRERLLDYRKDYYSENTLYYKEKYEAKKGTLEYIINKRFWAAWIRADKLHRVVGWSDYDKIHEIYKEATLKTIETGIQYEVDHIIPLTNKKVSGLHVHNNLQILTISENRSKANGF